MKTQKIKNKKSKGFTLVELMLVFAVIAGLSATVYIVYQKVNVSSRVTAEVDKIKVLYQGIDSMFASSDSFVNLGVNGASALINSKVAPPSMISGTSLVNIYGGTVTVGVANLPASSTQNKYYKIDYPGVPKSDCAKIIAGIGLVFNQISINGTTGTSVIKAYNSTTGLDPATTVAACDQTANTISFWGKKPG